MDHQATDASLTQLVQVLQQNDGRAELATELETLHAILGEQAVDCRYQYHPGQPRPIHGINLTLHLTLDPAIQQTHFALILHIPDDYPGNSEIPSVTLLDHRIGPFEVDPKLLESDHNHAPLQDQLLYDLILNSKECLERFYFHQIESHQQQKSPTEDEEASQLIQSSSNLTDSQHDLPPGSIQPHHVRSKVDLKFSVHSSIPILDRKSTFIGHSVSLIDPSHVPCIIQQLLGDKKVAKASHNIVAWRCEFNGCLHQDCDDDGESAAGSRMLHLLSILDVKNVLVCVSRWFGGIHLGADRFKHINQATRNALIIGGFITTNTSSSSSSTSNTTNLNKGSIQDRNKNSLKFKKKR